MFKKLWKFTACTADSEVRAVLFLEFDYFPFISPLRVNHRRTRCVV